MCVCVCVTELKDEGHHGGGRDGGDKAEAGAYFLEDPVRLKPEPPPPSANEQLPVSGYGYDPPPPAAMDTNSMWMLSLQV